MCPTSRERRVLVFAKAPRPGHTKTRLIPLLGATGAAELHARLIAHTLATAKCAGVGAVELHGFPAEDEFVRGCAARYQVRLVGQVSGDLGSKMAMALSRALAECASAILIGSDCPALTAQHLNRAADALDHGNDAVFVPTEDGGYALIGLRRCDPRIFADIAWSTSHVMGETRRRLQILGWRWEELETLWDVDRPVDYERLMAGRLLEPFPASANEP